VLIAPLSIQIRRAGVQKKFGTANIAEPDTACVRSTAAITNGQARTRIMIFGPKDDGTVVLGFA
jgi:hypothetical protein